MARSPFLLLLCVAAPVIVCSQSGGTDPVFAGIPFDEWFTQPEQTHFHWNVEVMDAVLSTHQRLLSRVRIKVDGDDLARRKGKGKFFMLVQVADEKGRIFRSHDDLDLESIQESIKSSDIEYLQPFFVLPGQYTFSVAVYDTATGEHNVARKRVHVPSLKNDPLPEAWRDLPAIEFISNAQEPDSWYLPLIQSRLYLPVRNKKKVQIELLLNLTPSERLAGSKRAQNRHLATLMPAFKVLSQVQWSDAAVNAAFLDLTRQRVPFEQHDFSHGTLDWERAAGTFADATPGLIDVKALAKRKFSADFFVKQIGARLDPPARSGDSDVPRVVIVLSSPVSFDPGVDLNPIEAGHLANSKLFYVRYQPAPPQIVMNRSGRGPGFDHIQLRGSFGPQGDDLEPLLKSVNPRLFDVSTPLQFRKALAGILAEIGAI